MNYSLSSNLDSAGFFYTNEERTVDSDLQFKVFLKVRYYFSLSLYFVLCLLTIIFISRHHAILPLAMSTEISANVLFTEVDQVFLVWVEKRYNAPSFAFRKASMNVEHESDELLNEMKLYPF